VISPVSNGHGFGMGQQGCKSKCNVSTLLQSYCCSLEDQMSSRKYFYKNSKLVQEGILNLLGLDFMSDLTDCEVEIDRRMLDFVVGLDTEFNEIVDGSHLYTPNVEFNDVILSDDIKSIVLDTVGNFDRLKQVEKEIELDKKITYGRGMCLLFYGASGTGKTMLANAIATKLQRKILLINFPTLGDNSAGNIIKLIFREAKIHNAVIFFDECESLFQNRDLGSRNVNMILTELERYDGISIMATNRPNELDEAMHRRITIALEFTKPDYILRERIWKSLCPAKLVLSPNVNINELAIKYELTGGFIKNSWLSALSFAVARDNQSPVVTQEDLIKASSHQLRGRLSLIDFDRRIIPTRGLDMVILSDSLKSNLQDIVNFGKAQSILFGQWGFNKQHGGSKGIAALFCGEPGTGKTMAAEAVGFDLGRPLKVVNCAQLLSKWVGETSKNIQAVFDEAKAVDSILVFDEAEGLFGNRSNESSKHDTMNVGILLHYIESFSNIVIIITNLKDKIDNAFFRRFKFILNFTKPLLKEREILWKLLMPEEAPIAKDVDFAQLANKYDFTGGDIKVVIFKAASRAALRTNSSDRVINMIDLTKACDEENEHQVLITNSMYI
jgi:SpoVK/Ycf46/Vps4 family AAA+-type ATPase